MKTFLLAICIVIFVSVLHAQNRKTVIYCSVSITGKVNYRDLAKLLPDSLRTGLLVDPRKDLHLRKLDHVLLYLVNTGWKLSAIQSDVGGNDIISTSNTYLLTKEIYLDAPARALFMENLFNIEKRK
jgi:hypothetical protein